MKNLKSEIQNLKSEGFTLVELVVVIVVVAIIASVAAMIILQGASAYSDEQKRSNIHYQARFAVERMAREARQIRSCADIVGAANPSGTLRFTDSNGNVVVFSVGGGNLSRGGNLLASGITSLTPFRFLDQNGNATTACNVPTALTDIWFVEIDVSDTQVPETLRVHTRVHPMNF